MAHRDGASTSTARTAPPGPAASMPHISTPRAALPRHCQPLSQQQRRKQTPREINGSAYGDCKWGVGKGGTWGTGCQVGISFPAAGCWCFSSYKVLTEEKLQATCSLELHEKAGRLLSLSWEIIEAMRAATSTGRRWLFLSRLLGLQATHVPQWSSKSGKEAELPAFPLYLARLKGILVTHHTWRSATLATGQQFSQ